jgi:hypothetical protein
MIDEDRMQLLEARVTILETALEKANKEFVALGVLLQRAFEVRNKHREEIVKAMNDLYEAVGPIINEFRIRQAQFMDQWMEFGTRGQKLPM